MLNGYVHLNNIFEDSMLLNAREHLIKSYKSEHLSFIENGELSKYYSLDTPYPVGKILKEVLEEIPTRNVLIIPTVYGSLSVKARLSQNIINLFVRNSKLKFNLDKIFGFSSEYFMHLAPAVRIIYPGNMVANVPVHIDSIYNPNLTGFVTNDQNSEMALPPFITAWVPIQGSIKTHGGLKLYPSCFKFSSLSINHEKRLWIPSLDVSDREVLLIDYSIGDCIIFHPNLAHGSHSPQLKDNFLASFNDNRFRVSIDVRIFPPTTTTTKHCISLNTGEIFNPVTV